MSIYEPTLNGKWHKVNYGTKGFLQDMASKETGIYVILGSTSSGKTTIMKQYKESLPENLRVVIETANPQEYKEFKGVNVNNVVTPFELKSANVVIFDEINFFDIKKVQDILMLSMKTNFGVVMHHKSIAEYIKDFRENSHFKFGSRTLLDRIKGITGTATLVHNKQNYKLSESMRINEGNIETFLQTEDSGLKDAVEREIRLQGMATISDQIKVLTTN